MKFVTLALLLLAPALARADAIATPPPPGQPIYNGTLVETCGWPTTVSMEGSCTGSLVHPEVVIYAGHCGSDYGSVQFGEDGEMPGRSVKTKQCWSESGVGDGNDFAVCRLAEPVTDVPIVPILMGCETEALQIGATTALIGFGEANNGPYGFKRETTAEIESFSGKEIFIFSDKGQDTCYGDSGGPVMIALADGTWRVFGVTSYGVGDCGTGTYYSMIHNGIPWFEEKTGVDITPCHTADGVWDPGPECGGFPKSPATPSGTWQGGCQVDGPRGGPSATCGPAYDAAEDTEPPQVEITDPQQGAKYMAVKTVPLTIAASARDDADQPEGWGIQVLRLRINGKELAGSERQVVPYTWDVELPSGAYLISAVAVDHAGNEAIAEPIAIGVNEAPPPLPEETTGGSSETGDASSSSGIDEPTPTTGGAPETSGSSATGADTSDQSGDDDGCGCRQSPRGGVLSLFALGLLGLRRRRLAIPEKHR